MRLYIGVDFHPHQQTACWLDEETGELRTKELLHNRKEVKAFYKGMPPSVVGIEASSQATWFEDLIFENGHELVIGDPALIRKRAVSRHKSDKRDAEHIYTLLVNGEFPTLWRRPRESVHLLEVMRLRQAFVRQRVQTGNRLQAMAHEVGLRKGTIRTAHFQELLREADMNEVQAMRLSHLFRLMESLDAQIGEIELWLKGKAEEANKVKILLTQRGVGYLTALCLVHTLGDVTRFTTTRQVTAFIGLDPLEQSSGSRTRFGHVSKAGSPLLRFLLGQSANIAVRYDARLKSFYKRLAKKKRNRWPKQRPPESLQSNSRSCFAIRSRPRSSTSVDARQLAMLERNMVRDDRFLMELCQPSSGEQQKPEVVRISVRGKSCGETASC